MTAYLYSDKSINRCGADINRNGLNP